MALFPSLVPNDNDKRLDTIQQGSLFHSIEYELSGIINKIQNINTLNDQEIRDIITRQHSMILNYDLFLQSNETRAQALYLFTNERFLKNFFEVIRNLELSNHEIVCLNKIAYDYYILDNKNKYIADKLYRLTTEINAKQVTVLSGIIGINGAQILAMIRNSSFKIEKCIHRVNTFIIKSNLNISVQNIIDIYCFLFPRFTDVFIYTMLEHKSDYIFSDYNKNMKFDNISIAILDILDSLTTQDITKVISDYAFVLNMIKPSYPVRFSFSSISSGTLGEKYARIISVINTVRCSSNINIP